jgi:sodium-coupled neutral amino acid transporter 11
MCALNTGAMLVVARCCELSGAYTYKDIARKALGGRGAVAVSAVMALYTLGSCVSFLVLIGDFLPALVLQAAIGGRELLMSVTGAAVLFPLALPRQLSTLRYTSTLSAVCIVYTAAMIALRALTAAPGARAPPGDVALFNGLEGLAVSAPIMAVAFTAHYNSARFFFELRDRSLRRFGGVLAASFGSVLALYIATAVGGYLLFGSATKGDVLSNFAGACAARGGGGGKECGGWGREL